MTLNEDVVTRDRPISLSAAMSAESASISGLAWTRRRQSAVSRGMGYLLTLRESILIFLFFTLLTVALTYPAAFHLTNRVIGSYPGDNFHYLWQLWYPAHAVFDLHAWPLFDPDVYAPYGFDLIKNQDLSPGTVLLFMPVTRLFGEVVTYNLLVLSSFMLTAFGTYLLAKQLWDSSAGAILAGIVIGFCSYRFTHATGHLTIVSTQWIPFFFLYLERTVQRPKFRNASLLGLFYALCALVTWYYAIAVAIAAVMYLSVRVAWRAEWRRLGSLFRSMIIAAVVALVLVGPFVVPYALATSKGDMAARPLEESQAFSASVADFFIPSVQHSLWGGWVKGHWRSGPNGQWLSEWEIYLGIVAVVLAIIGVLTRRSRVVTALTVMAVGSFLLALGPTLYLTHPATVPGAAHHIPLSSIPLPVSFFGNIPPFSFLRAWARMGFFVELAVGLLAAGALALLLRRINERFGPGSWKLQWALSTVVLALIILDTSAVPLGMAAVVPRPVDKWLAEQPGKFTVMEYPISNHAYSGPAMYSTRLTGKRIVMGYASYPPNSSSFGTLSLFPASETLDLLQAWGVKYVLVDEMLYRAGDEFWGIRQTWSTLEPAIKASKRLQDVAMLGRVHVYALASDVPRIIGDELLQNTGFEEATPTGPVGWISSGSPMYDWSEGNAHQGSAALAVTSHDFFVSTPILTHVGRCYQLKVFDRAAQQRSSVRLQINWLDSAGHELEPSTVASRVVAADTLWQEAKAQFRPPAGSVAAHVYAVAQEGSVWVDDYSLRELADGCEPSLTVIPNPVLVGPGENKIAVLWNTGDGSEGQITLSVDSGEESFFAQGSSGWRTETSVSAGSPYQFRLYAGMNRAKVLQSIKVMTGTQAASLTASPNPVPAGTGSGTTTISWGSGDGSECQVYVSEDGGPEKLFAQAPSGSVAAPWIQARRTYVFRLYAGLYHTRVLQTITVSRNGT